MGTPARPFRAEVVGSLLRPDYLKAAYRRYEAGKISEAGLAAAQDQAVREAIALYEDCGVDVLTDGEMRRRNWADPLTVSVSGYGKAPNLQVNWHGNQERAALAGASGRTPIAMGAAIVARAGKAPVNLPLQEVEGIKRRTSAPFKVTLPSLAHASVFWSPGVSDKVYATHAEYMGDVLRVMTEVVRECVEAGANYVQLDSPRYTHLLSEEGISNFRRLGLDPSTWLEDMIGYENALVDRFPDTTWALHLCRGNGPRGAWAISGGYEPIAERLFNEVHVERLLLEYDSPRAGAFAPLRFVPEGKTAVLGLVSTKDPEVESPDLLKRRLGEASQYVDLDQVSLSPQCGFASAFEGNLTEEIQRRKLETTVQVAREIWG